MREYESSDVKYKRRICINENGKSSRMEQNSESSKSKLEIKWVIQNKSATESRIKGLTLNEP